MMPYNNRDEMTEVKDKVEGKRAEGLAVTARIDYITAAAKVRN